MNGLDTALSHLAVASTALERTPRPVLKDAKDSLAAAERAVKLLKASVAFLEEGVYSVCEEPEPVAPLFGADGQPVPEAALAEATAAASEPPPPAPGGTLGMADPEAVDTSTAAFAKLLDEAEAIWTANDGKLKAWAKVRKAWMARHAHHPALTFVELRGRVDTPGASLNPDSPAFPEPTVVVKADAPEGSTGMTLHLPTGEAIPMAPDPDTPPAAPEGAQEAPEPPAGAEAPPAPVPAQEPPVAAQDGQEPPQPPAPDAPEPDPALVLGPPGTKIPVDGGWMFEVPDFESTPIFELDKGWLTGPLQAVLDLAGNGYNRDELRASWMTAWKEAMARTWWEAIAVLKDESRPLTPPRHAA